jgi:hypothetical protein
MRFVGGHLDPATWEDLTNNDYSVAFLDYDWSLNEQP